MNTSGLGLLRYIRFIGATGFLLAATGCATFSSDGGFGAIETSAKARLNKDVKWVRSEADADSVRGSVKERLAKPLTADDAVQIALLNNRDLQATYAGLGIAEADLVQAGRLRNPGFSFARLTRSDEKKIERAYFFDFLGLITMPLRTKMETRRFEHAKLTVASEMLQTAAETRKAFFRAVAAEETLKYMEHVKLAAEASAELARRMARAGNWGKLEQAREDLFYAEVLAQLARAKQASVSERERLTRLMGLWGDDTQFKLLGRLPDLPTNIDGPVDIEARALRERLDIQAAKQETEAMARALGLTKATGFINVLELGYLHNSETGQPRETGYEIEISIPIFDWGGSRTAKAEAIYMQSANRFAQAAINARSEVRETYSAYRTAYDIARHFRDEIVPLRKKIADENLLRYNGMLISVFELIADAREQVGSVNAYIEALRDFWLMESDLQMVLTGKSPGGGNATVTSLKTTANSGGGEH